MKMSDPAPEKCTACGSSNKMERVISATSFALKGSGWYTTDYRRPSEAQKLAAATTKPAETSAAPAVTPVAAPAASPAPGRKHQKGKRMTVAFVSVFFRTVYFRSMDERNFII